MLNFKKTTFLGIFLAFFSFSAVFGMARLSDAVISEFPEKCDSPDIYPLKKALVNSRPQATYASTDLREIIRTVNENTHACTLEETSVSRPERCATPALDEEAYEQWVRSQGFLLSKSEDEKEILPINQQESPKKPIAKKINTPQQVDPESVAICAFMTVADAIKYTNKNAFRSAPTTPRYQAWPIPQKSDDDYPYHFETIEEGTQLQIKNHQKDISPISRLNSQAQSESSAGTSSPKSALRKSPTSPHLTPGKRTVSYCANLTVLEEDDEIHIEPISKTAPTSHRTTPLPGQIEDDQYCQRGTKLTQKSRSDETFNHSSRRKSHTHNAIDDFFAPNPTNSPKSPFGGFFDPKPRKNSPNILEEFLSTSCRPVYNQPSSSQALNSPTQGQSAPVSPRKPSSKSKLWACMFPFFKNKKTK
ncbi:hypothetical protein CVU75_00890 [Candidatus Dependentiae bacterium HGW-Dependentiae-1]|nr:MAG: hypothetical protein CVU75_00890 [Candidatus Dependentiae bacterium HGW-Dependentiae-1]